MASQVPYTGVPTQSPNLSPTPSVSVNAPLAAFGGATAEATERLGKSSEQVGNELYSRALAMQELDQQAKAANAVAKFTDSVGDLDVKYRSLEGKTAVDGYPGYKDQLNQTRESIGNDLDSPYAQRIYLQESRNIQSRAVIGAGIHAGEQFKRYQIGTQQAVLDSDRKAVASNPEDDGLYQQKLAGTESVVDQLQALHGGSKEQRDDYATKAKSGLVFDRAQALARTDPVLAKKALDEAVQAGNITGEDAGRAAEFIRNHNINVTSRVQSSALLSGEGGHFGEEKVSPDRLIQAVGMVEGSGNYDPPHPTVKSGQYAGQHALGKYGVMQGNLQSWLKEAGMPTMSEQEFINDHAAQDKLAGFKLGQYQEETGSANKAALKWFTGDPNADLSRSDGGSTAGQYLQRLNSNLARTASASDLDTIAQKRAGELLPNDSEFQLHFQYHVQADHAHATQLIKAEEFDRKDMIDKAILPDKDGKLISSIDQIQDPAVHDAINRLSGPDRTKLEKTIAYNAKHQYEPTEENQKQYSQWVGRLTDPMLPQEERNKALFDADFTGMAMPAEQKQHLIDLRSKLYNNTQKNPAVDAAMRQLGGMLDSAGIDRKKNPDDFYLFRGTLFNLMNEQIQQTGKPYKLDEINQIGAKLLREQVLQPGWLWDTKGPAFKADVPEAEKTKIIQAHTDAGNPEPDEKTIQQIYAAHHYNEMYGKKKEAVQ